MLLHGLIDDDKGLVFHSSTVSLLTTRKMDELNRKYHLTLSRTFNLGSMPLIKLMNFVGIPIIRSDSNSISWFRLFYCSFIFLLVFSINFWLVVSLIFSIDQVAPSYTNGISSRTSSINLFIDCLNLAVYVISGYFFLFLLAQPRKWKSLTDLFAMLEKVIVPPDEFHSKFKKWSIFFTSYTIVSVVFLSHKDCDVILSRETNFIVSFLTFKTGSLS